MRKKSVAVKIWDQRYLVLFVAPLVLFMIIFNYIPMGGVVIAFKNYNPAKGFFGSPNVGFKFFIQFLTSYSFPSIMRNTIGISLMKLLLGFPLPILFALFLNEIRSLKYKRVIQTVSYLPHFLSWVVVLGIFRKLLSIDGGVVNVLIEALGGKPYSFFNEPKAIWPIVFFTDVWKELGWGSIIYLASLASVDPSLYEAAVVDGASMFQRMRHVSLPGILGTIMVLFILAVGGVLSSNFDQMYLISSSGVRDVSEVIDTYIYRGTLQQMQYSLGTAVGLMRSAITICLVLGTNWLSNRLADVSLF